jgi:hypothetical protein
MFLNADYERKLLDEVGRGQIGTRFKTKKSAGPRACARALSESAIVERG